MQKDFLKEALKILRNKKKRKLLLDAFEKSRKETEDILKENDKYYRIKPGSLDEPFTI